MFCLVIFVELIVCTVYSVQCTASMLQILDFNLTCKLYHKRKFLFAYANLLKLTELRVSCNRDKSKYCWDQMEC